MLAPPLSFSRRLVMGRAWSNTLTTNRHLGLALQDVSFVLGVLGCDANSYLFSSFHSLALGYTQAPPQVSAVCGTAAECNWRGVYEYTSV